METTAKTQRRKTPRKPGDSSVIRIEIKDGMGNPRWVTADLVDIVEGGFGLVLRTLLPSGSTVIARGKLGENRTNESVKVAVRWCHERADGTFRAGLEFLDSRSTATPDEEQTNSIDPNALDCYEAMQLSPNADPDTISRVYRMLALRYHPDNSQTGNAEMFVRLSKAHEILSDPEKRARYDVSHRNAKRLHWKIFDQASASTGSEGEKRKRDGILALLYAKMLSDPEQAEMNIQSLEELLGCPREHLQSPLWYLKGKNYIRRADNGRFSITITGFDEAEARRFAPVRADRQLPEATPAGGTRSAPGWEGSFQGSSNRPDGSA
jgi:curved DNA-binding protein CbpA